LILEKEKSENERKNNLVLTFLFALSVSSQISVRLMLSTNCSTRLLSLLTSIVQFKFR